MKYIQTDLFPRKRKYKGIRSSIKWIGNDMAQLLNNKKYIQHVAQFSRKSNYLKKHKYNKNK